MKRIAPIVLGLGVIAAGIHFFSRETAMEQSKEKPDEIRAASVPQDAAPADTPEPEKAAPRAVTQDAGPEPGSTDGAKRPSADEIGEKALQGLDTTTLTLSDLEGLGVPDNIKHGILVDKVHPQSRAAWAGIKTGDVIFRAQRTQVTEVSKLREAVYGRDHTVIRVIRDGQFLSLVLKPPLPARQ